MKMDLSELTDFGEKNTLPAVLSAACISQGSRTQNISFCGNVNIFIT